MAMTYEESAALMVDPTFRGRVKVSVLKYASYILSEAPGTPGHSSRVRWAQEATRSPEVVATNVQPPVVMEDGVQSAGASITDAALQTAVETTVNKML